MMTTRLAFLRPHKTGSMSFHHSISRLYVPEEICPLPFAYQLSRSTPDELRQYRYFWPHASISQIQSLGDVKVGSVIRQPTRRLLSSFYYWKAQLFPGAPTWIRRMGGRLQVPRGRHNVAYKLQNMTLLDFLTSGDPDIVRAADNYLVRFFSGGAFGNTNSERTQIHLPHDHVEESDLEQALANLTHFDFILVLERYLDSLKLARLATGLPIEAREVTTNVNPRRSNHALSKAESRALAQRTRYDAALYDQVLELFEGRLVELTRDTSDSDL